MFVVFRENNLIFAVSPCCCKRRTGRDYIKGIGLKCVSVCLWLFAEFIGDRFKGQDAKGRFVL